MLNNSWTCSNQNIVVSGGSWTVVHGNSITYESQHATHPTSSPAKIEALKMLYENIAAGAMHNSKERYDAPKCHPDTRKAVLNDITSWILDHSKKTSILWLSAPAGSGKSAILQKISEKFHKLGGLSASFFFSRSATKRNTDTYLIATLSSQLATSIPATRPFIEGAIERDPSIFQRLLTEQIKHLVVFPLVYASLHPQNGSPWPTLLVIDGLDECNGGEHQVDILRVLRGALLQLKRCLPRLYLLIASRPEPAITTVFHHDLSEITRHLVLDNTYNPDRDIALFLRSSFADIYRRRHAWFPSITTLPQPWPHKHDISFLVKKSSGQFIFAATVIRFIDVDRKSPTAQLQLILDICKSVDSSRFGANPFALLDGLYSHILNSSEEKKQVISILGATFYLKESPTLGLLRALLRLEREDMTMIFWDLHSIIRIPASDKDPIHFYHASFRDFLMDQHRSGNLYADRSMAHSFLLKLCIQTLSDFYGGSTHKRMALALQYSRNHYITHYVDGDKLNPGFLDRVLEEFNPETWLPLNNSAGIATFISWFNKFALLRVRFHNRCNAERCSTLCFRYTSILDQYLVHRFQKHKSPAVVAALMWLTLLSPAGWGPTCLRTYVLTMRDVEWLWTVPTCIEDNVQLLCFLTGFLSDYRRSGNLFVGSAVSTTHFAHVCAQRAWRDILVLDHPFGSENWWMLIYLYDLLNLLIPSHGESSQLTKDQVMQCIQVRIDDIASRVKFIEAAAPGEAGSPEEQVSRWICDIRTRGSSLIDFTTASPQDEIGASGSRVKCEKRPTPSFHGGSKRRRIDLTDPNEKTVTKDIAPRCEGGDNVNDGRDIEMR